MVTMIVGTDEYLTKRGLVKQENDLFHYTNVNALKLIMDSNTLLATHMQYMNDWSEYEQGYEKLIKKLKEIIENNQDIFREEYQVVRDKVKELPEQCPKTPQEYSDFIMEKNKTYMEKLLPEVYSVSFCRQSDLLNQWINYARESGICIEFDFRGFEFVCPDVDEKIYSLYKKDDIDKKRIYKHCRPMQIIYDEDVMLNVITNDISAYLQGIYGKDKMLIEEEWWAEMGKVFSIVPFFKHQAFSPEEEVRLAVRPIAVPLNYKGPDEGKLSGIFRAKIYHIESNHILKPRLKIQWKNDGTGNSVTNSPIKSITAGPGVNQQMTYQSIIHYIEYELDNIPVLSKVEREKLKIAESVKASKSSFKDTYVTNKGIIVRKSNIPYIY